MATKKQKRLAGEARQAKNREAARQSGLKAQARDRELRERRARKLLDEIKARQKAQIAEMLEDEGTADEDFACL